MIKVNQYERRTKITREILSDRERAIEHLRQANELLGAAEYIEPSPFFGGSIDELRSSLKKLIKSMESEESRKTLREFVNEHLELDED